MSQSAPEESGPQRSALKELAKDDASRKKFLKMVGGTGAAGAFGIFLAACGSDKKKTTSDQAAPSSSGSAAGDLKILNYALTLEYLETAFYKDVVGSGLFKGADLETIKKFGDQEAEHVEPVPGEEGQADQQQAAGDHHEPLSSTEPGQQSHPPQCRPHHATKATVPW